MTTKPGLTSLPIDLLVSVVSVLPAQDALSLSRTSKKFAQDIGYAIIRPSLKLFESISTLRNFNNAQKICKRPEIPTKLFGNKVHTIRLQCQATIPAWGQRQRRGQYSSSFGQLYIVAEENESEQNGKNETNKTEFGENTRVVVTSSEMRYDRSTESVRMEFHPEDDKTYRLCCQVGGGTGKLRLSDVRLFYAIHSDPGRRVTNAVSFLSTVELWGPPLRDQSYIFYQSLVALTSKLLLEGISNGREPDHELTALFQRFDLEQLDEPSLRPLRLIISNLMEYFDKVNLSGAGADDRVELNGINRRRHFMDVSSSSSSDSSDDSEDESSSSEDGDYDSYRTRWVSGQARWERNSGIDSESDEESVRSTHSDYPSMLLPRPRIRISLVSSSSESDTGESDDSNEEVEAQTPEQS